MADYYPLIARAIAGLDPSAPGESRRALYERARSALIAQLRSVQPPLSESEITRERLSLEEAVRKVESEAAQRAREPVAAGRRPLAWRRRLPPRQCAPAGSRRLRRSANISAAPAAVAAVPRRRPGAKPAQPAPRRAAARATASAAAAASAAGTAAAADPRTLRQRRAAGPIIRRRRCRSRPACAASATSPPTPTISAAPRRRPIAPRERPMPTCRRPRRNSTGSSPAWRTAARSGCALFLRRVAGGGRPLFAAIPADAAAAAARADRPGRRARAEEARAHRCGISVQERDRDRRRADPGRRRHLSGASRR